MSRMTGAGWPYCETVEVLERRAWRRTVLVEVAGAVVAVAGVLATWQGLTWYAVATVAA